MKMKKKEMSGRETTAVIFSFYSSLLLLFIMWAKKSSYRGGGFINQCDMDVRVIITLIAIIFGSMSVYKFVNYRNR